MKFIDLYPYIANGVMLLTSYLVMYQIVQSQIFQRKVETGLRGSISEASSITDAVKTKAKLNPGSQLGEVIRLVVTQQHTGLLLLKTASPQLGMALTVIALVLFGWFGTGLDTASLLSLFTAALTTTAIGAVNAFVANVYLNIKMNVLCDNVSELYIKRQLREKRQQQTNNSYKLAAARA